MDIIGSFQCASKDGLAHWILARLGLTAYMASGMITRENHKSKGGVTVKKEGKDLSNPQSTSDYLRLILTGFAMGAADIVPGVSGGTMAFIPWCLREISQRDKILQSGRSSTAFRFQNSRIARSHFFSVPGRARRRIVAGSYVVGRLSQRCHG